MPCAQNGEERAPGTDDAQPTQQAASVSIVAATPAADSTVTTTTTATTPAAAAQGSACDSGRRVLPCVL